MLRGMEIVIAFDGSPSAAAAVRAAGALLPGAHATVASVRHDASAPRDTAALARIALPDEVIRTGIAEIDRALEEEASTTAAEGAQLATEAGLDAEPSVARASGSAWPAIRRLAQERDADMIVCGSRGQGTLARVTLGSTSSSLVHNLERPVLVVPEEGGTPGGPIVIGYDGSEESAAAIERAAALFPGREAVVVHVWESPLRHTLSGRALGSVPLSEIREMTGDFEEYFADGARLLAEQGAALALDRGLAATAVGHEASGAAWRGLADTARDAGASLVVVGSRGRGALTATVLGSVSSGLAHNAETPVLIVP